MKLFSNSIMSVEEKKMNQCQGITDLGKRCKMETKRGVLCWIHEKKKLKQTTMSKKLPQLKIRPQTLNKNHPPSAKSICLQAPIVDLYQFRIENMNQNLPNHFSSDFKTTKTCGEIKADNLSIDYEGPSQMKSSCDYIQTTTNKSDITTARHKWHPFISSLYDLCLLIPSKVPTFPPYTERSKYRLTPEQIQSRTEWSHNHFSMFKELIIEQKARNLQDLSDVGIASTTPGHIRVVSVPAHSHAKVVILGDIHGSMHTLLRHMFRFAVLNILDLATLKLKKSYYKIIFIGDAIDRGIGCLEVLILILLLLKNNPNQVFYNRGNHESDTVKQELISDISTRVNDPNLLFPWLWNMFPDFFNSFSCAVILKTEYKNANKHHYTWIAHASFQPSALKQHFSINQLEQDAYIALKEPPLEIFWSDFDDTESETRGGMRTYSSKDLSNFLNLNHLNFVIRGHQDFSSNSYLFGSQYVIPSSEFRTFEMEMPGFPLNFVHTPVCIKGQNDNDVVLFHSSKNQRVNGPIASVVADKEQFNFEDEVFSARVLSKDGTSLQDKQTNPMRVFPCLVLSTNTDVDRPLVCDSFAILRSRGKK
jgi:hypothetical protein